MRVSVVIPTYDEARSIASVLDEIPASLVTEVLVVDAGSTDGTGEIAAAHGARVIFEPRRGYGRACLTGLAAADNPDTVVFLDGDYSDRPRELGRLIDPIREGRADVVLGSRLAGGLVPGAMPWHAVFGNRLASIAERFGLRVTRHEVPWGQAADPAAVAPMLRASLAARPPHAAVEGITLRAHPLRAPKAQPRFDEPPGPSPRLLTAALARLSGLVGASGIGAPELLDSHRPDAMQMTPFLLSPQGREGASSFPNQIPLPHRARGPQFELSRKSVEASAEIDQGAVLAVRRMRPPRPAQVTLAAGVPTHLRATGLASRIVTGAGPWRVSGEWWTNDAFVQDEWDVELGDGTLCRLARDGRGWRLEAIYD